MMKRVRTRFAPSPTGYLHIGGLRTALYAYLFAKKNGGDFVLRVEDTDRQRLVEGACEVIYSTLKETGVMYDEGPDVGGDYGPYIQSEREGIYKKYVDQLIESGAAYYCFCTKERLADLRAEKEAKKENFTYDKHCLNLSKEQIAEKIEAGQTYVVRQNIPTQGDTTYSDAVYGDITVPNADLDDNVLLKTDGMPTYNLANVIDDYLMGITHIIRGVEYLSSTPKYNHLYTALGWEIPQYIHLPPVMKDSKQKLSKRHGDASFKDFIDKGYLKEAIINYIALLGWSGKGNQEIYTFDELIKAFNLEGLSKSPAIFDVEKLTWMNAQYIRNYSTEEFIKKAMPYFKQAKVENFDLEMITQMIQPRLEHMIDIPEKLAFLNEMPDYNLDLYFHKRMKTNSEMALSVLMPCKEVLEKAVDFTKDGLHDDLMALVETLGVKTGQVLWPLRVAITGTLVTPGGAFEAAHLLGKDETLRRLNVSIEKLNNQ
jgi:glutamyl-tRNA synthetase